MRRASPAGFIAVVLLLGACSGAEVGPAADAGPAPTGFVLLEEEGVSFVYPEGWRQLADDERFKPSSDLEISGPEGALGLPPLIVVERGLQATGQFEESLQLAQGLAGLDTSREVVREEETTVAGAEEAVLIEDMGTQYLLDDEILVGPPPSEQADEADSVEVRRIAVFAGTPEGEMVLFQVLVPEPDYGELADEVTRIIESFEVRSSVAES